MMASTNSSSGSAGGATSGATRPVTIAPLMSDVALPHDHAQNDRSRSGVDAATNSPSERNTRYSLVFY